MRIRRNDARHDRNVVRFALFVILAFAVFASRASAAGDELDLATVLAKETVANAKPPAYSEQIQTTDTQTYVETVYHDGGDQRTVVGNGPHHTESGVRKRIGWHQNDNGLTVVDDSESLRTPPAIQTSMSRQTSPFPAYVVSRTCADGCTTRDYIEPITFHIIQSITHTALGDITTTYDDFRHVGAHTFAFHWVTDDSARMLKTNRRIVRFIDQAPSANDLDIPPLRRNLVDFPAGVSRVDLPVHFDKSAIIVPVEISGHRFDFAIDTGAGGIILDPSVARTLNLSSITNGVSQINAGRYMNATATLPEMRIGSLSMHDIDVSIAPLPKEHGGPSGLLGFDFLATLGLTLDYQHHTVSVVPGTAYQPPTGAPRISLDVHLGNQVPMTTVRINGATSDHIIIDTGAETTLTTFATFARRNANALVGYRPLAADAQQLEFSGVGGENQATAYTINQLDVGGLHFTDFLAYQNASKTAYSSIDGFFGGLFLQFFTIGVDFPDGRMDFVPNDLGRQAKER